MDPRISFSNDFVDAQQAMKMKHEGIYREAPVSSDFEFCVKNYGMISADEVFSQGMLVPLKSGTTMTTSNKRMTTTTLRDELLVGDDLYDDVLPRVPKSSISCRWKERLGLRRIASNNSNKKDHKNDGFLQRVAEEERHTNDNNNLVNITLCLIIYIHIYPFLLHPSIWYIYI